MSVPVWMIKDITSTAKAQREAGAFVNIDHRLPTVLVHLDDDEEFFFQEHEASELLDHTPEQVSEQDYLLWLSKGW